MEAFETKRFKQEQERHYTLDLRQAKLRLISSPVTEMIGAFIAVILLWIGGHDVLVSNDMTSEEFIRFIFILFSCANIVMPTGGEKDIEPPKIQNVIVKNTKTSTTIQFDFDEYLQCILL